MKIFEILCFASVCAMAILVQGCSPGATPAGSSGAGASSGTPAATGSSAARPAAGGGGGERGAGVSAPSSATSNSGTTGTSTSGTTNTSNPTTAPAAVVGTETAGGTSHAGKENTLVENQIATFGAGCFWGVEATFRQLPGVVDAAVGYAGGHTKNPTYKDVCSDETGHAEVVQITFDPSKVTYEKIVEIFFKMHDPTQLNRQGPDYGTQYRSVIFFHSEEQQKVAEAVKGKFSASGKYKKPIVTTIEPAPKFYKAEEYHQQYFAKHGLENTCHLPQPD